MSIRVKTRILRVESATIESSRVTFLDTMAEAEIILLHNCPHDVVKEWLCDKKENEYFDENGYIIREPLVVALAWVVQHHNPVSVIATLGLLNNDYHISVHEASDFLARAAIYIHPYVVQEILDIWEFDSTIHGRSYDYRLLRYGLHRNFYIAKLLQDTFKWTTEEAHTHDTALFLLVSSEHCKVTHRAHLEWLLGTFRYSMAKGRACDFHRNRLLHFPYLNGKIDTLRVLQERFCYTRDEIDTVHGEAVKLQSVSPRAERTIQESKDFFDTIFHIMALLPHKIEESDDGQEVKYRSYQGDNTSHVTIYYDTEHGTYLPKRIRFEGYPTTHEIDYSCLTGVMINGTHYAVEMSEKHSEHQSVVFVSNDTPPVLIPCFYDEIPYPYAT